MTQQLRLEYEQELAELKLKMLDAQKFAEKFPAFSEKILLNKFDSNFTGEISKKYKTLRFGWGIKRWFYTEKGNITNYRGDFAPQYLWNIYINQYALFGDTYADAGLYEIKNEIDLFFFDALNTTFYATDEQLMPLLDALAAWYEKAKPINDEFRKKKNVKSYS